jgi:hypothetical protein
VATDDGNNHAEFPIMSSLSRCEANSGRVSLYNSQLRHKPSVEVLRNGEEGIREEGPESN